MLFLLIILLCHVVIASTVGVEPRQVQALTRLPRYLLCLTELRPKHAAHPHHARPRA
jgi:hypothetical protein